MAPQRRRTMSFVGGIVACAATVSTVTWLSTMIASQHHQSDHGQLHSRHSLLSEDTAFSQQGNDAMSGLAQRSNVLEKNVLASRGDELNSGASKQQDSVQQQNSVQQVTKDAGVLDTSSSDAAAVSIVKQKTQEEGLSTSGKSTSHCNIWPNTDYAGGNVVVWGPFNKVATAEECCASCKAHAGKAGEEPCKYWMFCADKAKCKESYGDCWLKTTAHINAMKPDRGPHVKYTAGILDEYYDNFSLEQVDAGGEDRTYHVVVTAQGTATHWQSRIAYYWYKKIQKQCRETHKVCHMGGWTRLLHSGEPDDLMEEIPTVVVRPLEDKDHKGYVVLNRPWAFVQWLRDHTVPEKYILMSEPDHLWMKPMPNIMQGDIPAGFPFFYIEPTKPEYSPYVQRFTGPLVKQQLESIPPIGNAPTMMLLTDLKKMAEIWMNTTHDIFDDEEVHKAWNWVLEMWGFAIATFKAGVKPASLHWRMMCQIPYDEEPPTGPEHFILHYTYGMDYRLTGEPMFGKIGEWRFDKRSYGHEVLPRNLGFPPAGVKNQYVWRFIRMLNEATEMIPGWDDYVKTGIAREHWDGKTFKE